MFRTLVLPATLTLSLLAAASSAQQVAGSQTASGADAAPASPAALLGLGTLGTGGTVGSDPRVSGFTGGGYGVLLPPTPFVNFFDARYVNDNQAEVDGADLAAGSVGSAAVTNDAITGAHVANGSLSGSDLADGSISGQKVANFSITDVDIAANSIFAFHIQDSAITGSEILNGSIGSADIGGNAVSGSHIQTGAVGSSDVLDNSLGAIDLATNSVGADELANDAVGAGELSNAVFNWSFNSSPYSNVDYRMRCEDQDSFAHGVMIETPTAYVGDFVLSTYLDNGDHKFRVDSSGNVFADGSITGGGALANLVQSTEDEREHLRGDVLVIDPQNPRAVRLARGARSTLVIGVFDDQPGILSSHREFDRVVEMDGVFEGPGGEFLPPRSEILSLADMHDLYGEVPVATGGIVEVRVSAENGPILPGDLLVTAWTTGHAMRDPAPAVGTVLGKALGPLQSGTGVIEVLITLD